MAVLTGVGVMSVTLIMMLSPAAAAVNSGATYVAPYKGASAPSNSYTLENCAKVKVLKAMGAKLKTGAAIVANSGSTTACKGLLSKDESFADSGNYVKMAIPVSIGATSSSVAVNSAWKVTGTATASSGKHATCSATVYHDQFTYLDWGYTGSYFPYYNDTYNYSGSIDSFGSGAAPSPFNFNSTSEFDQENESGAYNSCSSMGEWAVMSSASLADLTTGTSYLPSATTVPAWNSVGEVEVFETIDWNCYSVVDWYGPTATWSNTTLTCNTYNSTLTSLVYNGVSTTGTNATQTYSNTTSGLGSWYFNSTASGGTINWSSSDHFAVVIEVGDDWNTNFNYEYAGSWEYGWASGSGSWAMNMATLGNGWDLKSISVT